ncbi:MAG TPA: PilC/PilY family type IV pilus protein [Nitrospira sp.]|nr:PilC/PilY family type IV pilus protein [Nitrospira sp.]
MKKLICAVLALVLLTFLPHTVSATSPTVYSINDYTAYPPFLASAAPPLVMLVMSRDHRLFFKAYNDVMDMDDDGVVDTTYKDTIDYYGYFNPNACYDYVSSNSRFEPKAAATGTNSHYCTSRWSGNFLNWATMARIDIIRKVFYGGYRSVDTSNTTVLSRTKLPRDAHSWVKAYNGSDISQLTPNNWTAISLCNLNETKTDANPLVYVINGFKPYAASTEGKECVSEYQGGPALTIAATLAVNVLVCNATLMDPNCAEYKSGASASSWKPTGIMQNLGVNRNGTPDPSDDITTMNFGLMTGSYSNNVSGGVLRTNIVDINNEVDNTNGQIKGTSKIIANINNFQVIQYNYTTGWYDIGGAEGTCVPSEPVVLTNGVCKSWGNPIGEILYETVRYFKALGAPTSEYRPSNPDQGLSSLTVEAQWNDPFTNCPPCSKPFALVFSDASPSYDSDHLPGSNWYQAISTSDIPSVQTLINNSGINTLEGTGNFFIGDSAANTPNTDRTCSPKTVTSFGTMRGLCSEEPTKQGAFYTAAIAHYAKTNDLRSLSYVQKMTTYSVVTNSPYPQLEFTIGGNKVQIVPSFNDGCPTASYPGCTSQGQNGDNSKGEIVDFQFCRADAADTDGNGTLDDWTTAQAQGYQHCYDVMWDDAEFGWDYELDIRHRIYVRENANTIDVMTRGLYAAAGHTDYAGYLIKGVTNGGEFLDIMCGGTAGFNTCKRYDGNATPVSTRNFTPNGSSAGELKDPLWYAAKYGGFEDRNGNNQPDLQGEWDSNGNGVPDTYFYAANPLKLEDQLTAAFLSILNRTTSGTAASVLASSTTGEGALFQSYFFPVHNEADGREIKWVGYTQGLWIDAYGNLREDTVNDGKLVLNQDRIVVTRYDSSLQATVADIYADTNGDGKADGAVVQPNVLLSDLIPIWEAGKRLAITNPGTTCSLASARAGSCRRILTYVDRNGDNRVSAVANDEVIEFERTSTSPSPTPLAKITPFLRADATAPYTATNLIDFIRGNQVTNLRDRMMSVDAGSGAQNYVWKLGDPVNSTPTLVGAPRERYDVLYGDPDYSAFYLAWKDRRQVSYFGANDGMLHAVNVGFYHKGDGSTHHGCYTATSADTCAGQNPSNVGVLGNELWAFIPQEMLPHLRWLADPKYTHVYYVDLKPKVTDAKIFCQTAGSGVSAGPASCINGQNNTTHHGGWGTILIGGFRFGGSCYVCPTTGTGNGRAMTFTAQFNGSTNQERAFYSGYFVMDITNPEEEPKLLWTFTHQDLGFATSYPTVARVRPFDSNSKTSSTNTFWYAVFGSGATSYNGNSGQKPKMFYVDLVAGPTAASGALNGQVKYLNGHDSTSNAFFGDVITVDRDLDFRVDSVYAGETFASTPWHGALVRVTTGCGAKTSPTCQTAPDSWGVAYTVNTASPGRGPSIVLDNFYDGTSAFNLGAIVQAPSVAIDDSNNVWVFAGSGRYFNTADKTNTEVQTLFGVKDPVLGYTCPSSGVETFTGCQVAPSGTTTGTNTLVNMSTAAVCVVGTGSGSSACTPSNQVSGVSGATSYQSLVSLVQGKAGWFVKLPVPTGSAAERLSGTPIVAGGIVFLPTFLPSSDVCVVAGTGSMYGLYYVTGGAYSSPVIGTTAGTSGAADTINTKVTLGEGLSSQIALHIGVQGSGTTGGGSASGLLGCSQSTTGALNCVNINPAMGVTSRYISWINQRD